MPNQNTTPDQGTSTESPAAPTTTPHTTTVPRYQPQIPQPGDAPQLPASDDAAGS